MKRLDVIKGIIDSRIEAISVSADKNVVFIRKNEYTHSYGVASFCKLLAMKRGLDPEIGAIIGHMHDLGRIMYNIVGGNHPEVGSDEAEKILLETGLFSKEEIVTICTSIKYHGNKDVLDGPYDELIKDCDLLERYLWKPYYIDDEVKKQRLLKVLDEMNIEFEPLI